MEFQKVNTWERICAHQPGGVVFGQVEEQINPIFFSFSLLSFLPIM